MDARMVIAFVLALIAFSLLFAALFWHRLRLGLRQLPEVAERPSEEGEERA
jgi:hypothetical protein